MLTFKSGVDFRGMSPQIVLAMLVADQCNTERETVVTSVTDNAPGRLPNSRHRSGNAVDFRTKGHPDAAGWAARMRAKLAPQFQVVYEVPPQVKPENEHIHCEFDPPENKK